MRMSRLNRSQRQDALKVFSAWRRQGFDYRLTPATAEALTGIAYPDGEEVRLIELAVKYVLLHVTEKRQADARGDRYVL